MRYLDLEQLRAIDPVALRSQKPYPWINPQGILTEEGFQLLCETLPPLTLFSSRFGEERKYEQQSHDRFTLEYHDDLDIAPPWKEFIAELRGEDYQSIVSRLHGHRSFDLLFHRHYTPNRCSVSPHCDARPKLRPHIFYFNKSQDWDPAWGGETVILDDGGKFSYKTAPHFEDFKQIIPAEAMGNRSLLFFTTKRSWHGVRPLTCPPGHLRKVFIVVVNQYTLIDRVRRFFGEPSKGYE